MDLSPHNRFFELARVGTLRLSGWPARLYPLFVIVYGLVTPLLTSAVVSVPLVVILYLIGAGQARIETLLGTGPGLTALLVVSFGPIFVLVWFWLKVFERRPLWTLGLERSGWLFKYLRGAIWGTLMIAAAIGLPAIFGYMRLEWGDLSLGVAATSALVVLLGWMVQGAAEEVLFRGFLFQIIGVRVGLFAGMLVSSVLFALLHIFNENIGLLALVNLILFGLFAAVYSLREGGLWGIFALHTAWNWAQANLFGMKVSGVPIHLTPVVNIKEVGPDWFTGGLFGPEGGLGVTLILLAGLLALLWVWRGDKG